MKQLLSVVVPVYNVEEHLHDCVDSILNQSYENIELILIDDGSTDGSGAICDEYSLHDKRVKTYHVKNSGPSAARNLGIKERSGSLLAFVDSDDVVEMNAYSHIIEQMELHHAGMGIFSWITVNETDGNSVKPKLGINGCVDAAELQKIIAFQDEVGGGGFPWNRVVRVSEILDIEGNPPLFPNDISVYEDKCWIVEVLNRVKTVYVSDNVGYRYFVRSSGLTHRDPLKKLPDQITSWTYVVEGLRNSGRLTRELECRYHELMMYGLLKLVNVYPNKAREFWCRYKKSKSGWVSIKYFIKRVILKAKLFSCKVRF